MGKIFRFSHKKDKVAGDKDMPGATMVGTGEDYYQVHSLFSFINQISMLPPGKY